LHCGGAAAINRNNLFTSGAAVQDWCGIEPSYIENMSLATLRRSSAGEGCCAQRRQCIATFPPRGFALLSTDAKFAQLFYFTAGDFSAWTVSGGWSSLAASPMR
jgi:hypothetical protein